jgi:hypothetical protein
MESGRLGHSPAYPVPGVEILVAIDALDDLLHNAGRVPLTGQARINPEALGAAVARIRRAHVETFGMLPGTDPPVAATSRLVAELEAIAAEAPAVPLTSQVRVDQEAVLDRLDTLRAELPAAIRSIGGTPPPPPKETGELLVAIDALDDAVHRARSVPLTEQVRFKPDDLRELVARVRATVDGERLTPALDELDAIIARARPVPLTDHVRIPKKELRAQLDELIGLVGPPGR